MLNHRISRKNIHPLEDDDSARPCCLQYDQFLRFFESFVRI